MAGIFITRPGWADVEPVPQEDGPNPVVSIRYTEEFRSTMDLFRAVLRAQELSARALALTGEVVASNPANYTAWQYRRQCLAATGADLREELRFTEATAYDNPKNYQIWYHRRAVVERLGDPSAELAFLSNVLLEDGKNYHAWSYRQWLLTTFGQTHGLWSGELDRLHNLLLIDHFNNSAWNQRWFTVERTDGGVQPWTPEVVRREFAYALSWARKEPRNESPWAYVRGLMRVAPSSAPLEEATGEPPLELAAGAAAGGAATAVAPPLASSNSAGGWRFNEYPEFKAELLAVRDEVPGGDQSAPLLGLLFELHAADAAQLGAPERAAALAEARAALSTLEAMDGVRASYWQRRRALLAHLD